MPEITRIDDIDEQQAIEFILKFFWDMGICAMKIETLDDIQFIPMPHIYENRTTVH